MGVITLALVAHGDLGSHHSEVPTWVVICAASAIALGTYAGGWRIIRTVGMRIIRMDAAQGFAAQGVGAVVILLSSHFGYPLSSTHVISGGVMGAGAGQAPVGGALGRGRHDRRRLGRHPSGGRAVRAPAPTRWLRVRDRRARTAADHRSSP